MKTGTVNQKEAVETVTMVASATAGAMVSDLAVSKVSALISKDDPTKNTKLVRAGVVVASVFGALVIKGKETAANVSRGALIGMALQQGIKVTREVLQKAVEGKEIASNEYVAPLLGLGCANATQREFPTNYKPAYQERLAVPFGNTPIQRGTPTLAG